MTMSRLFSMGSVSADTIGVWQNVPSSSLYRRDTVCRHGQKNNVNIGLPLAFTSSISLTSNCAIYSCDVTAAWYLLNAVG